MDLIDGSGVADPSDIGSPVVHPPAPLGAKLKASALSMWFDPSDARLYVMSKALAPAQVFDISTAAFAAPSKDNTTADVINPAEGFKLTASSEAVKPLAPELSAACISAVDLLPSTLHCTGLTWLLTCHADSFCAASHHASSPAHASGVLADRNWLGVGCQSMLMEQWTRQLPSSKGPSSSCCWELATLSELPRAVFEFLTKQNGIVSDHVFGVRWPVYWFAQLDA